MKTFIKNNWFRMLIGTSAFITSVGFFIHSINPSYATNPQPFNTSNLATTNGYVEGNYVYFISGSYIFKIQKGDLNMAFEHADHFGSSFQDEGLKDPVTKVNRKCFFDAKKIVDY